MKNYSLVSTYTTEFEAKIAEAILMEAGIPSLLQSPDVYPPQDYRQGIRLYVNPEDVESATSLLEDFSRDLAEGNWKRRRR